MLVLVRHAEPDIDPRVPASQWTLSPKGQHSARDLAEPLRAFGSQHLVSSSEPKAVETAQLAANQLGVETSIAAGLHEHLRLHVPFFDEPSAFRNAIKRFFAEPDALVFGEETAAAARDRFCASVDGIAATWRHAEPVTIVSHGTVISLFVEERTDADAFATWSALSLPTIVCVKDGRAQILL